MDIPTVEKTVYAPLIEEDSILLTVTEGCSYGKCAFCDFANDKYTVLPLEWVKENASTSQRNQEISLRSFCSDKFSISARLTL